MASAYDKAVAALYQAPHESFVDERERLAAELKSEGDKPGAARLAKLGRPTISAWAVNQLWWHAQGDFDELFATAAELRAGKLSASSAHRKAVAKLTAEALRLLKASGHGVADSTLRRITMTLSGLAASGGFEPEAPGALTKDRDPPGFEAFGIKSFGGERDEAPAPKQEKHATSQKKAAPAQRHAENHDKHASELAEKHAAAEAERARKAAEAERVRQAEQREARQAKRRELEGALREAKGVLTEHEQERSRLTKELANADHLVERAAMAVAKAEARIADLGEEP